MRVFKVVSSGHGRGARMCECVYLNIQNEQVDYTRYTHHSTHIGCAANVCVCVLTRDVYVELWVV